MKGEIWTFGILTAFFALITPIYWYWSYDPTGTTALALTFGLCFLIGFYLAFTGRRLTVDRPEDRSDAEISDGAGELGFYSPHSWWPLVVASGGAILFLGLVFGFWLALIGAAWLAVAVVGFVFEYYRGEHAH